MKIFETEAALALAILTDNQLVKVKDTELEYLVAATGIGVALASSNVAIPQVSAKSGRKNLFRNGAFQIAQRGSVVANTTPTASIYTLDGVVASISAVETSTTISQVSHPQGFNDYPNYSGFYMNVDCVNSGSQAILQSITEEYKLILNRNVTISFWYKTDLAIPLTVAVVLRDGLSSVGQLLLSNQPLSSAPVVAWTKFQTTFAVGDGTGFTPVSAGNISTNISTGGAVATGNLQIANLQIEIGSQATDFEYRPIAEEVALCQRYYEKSYNQQTIPGSGSGASGSEVIMANGTSAIANQQSARKSVNYKVAKRIAATATIYNASTGALNEFREIAAGTGIAAANQGVAEAGFTAANTAAVIDNRTYIFHWTADAEIY